MNRLRHSAIRGQKQFECLAGILKDEKLDVVIRDYSAQHMASLLLREDCTALMIQNITELLFKRAALHTDSTISGTILMSLNQVCQHRTDRGDETFDRLVPKKRLFAACRVVANNEKSIPSNIASAVAVAGELSKSDETIPFPDWVVSLFQSSARPEKSDDPNGSFLVPLACARVLLDSGKTEHGELVRKTSESLGTSSLVGRMLEKMLIAPAKSTLKPEIK